MRGIDTADTRFESTWYRYRKHKSGIAHHYHLGKSKQYLDITQPLHTHTHRKKKKSGAHTQTHTKKTTQKTHTHTQTPHTHTHTNTYT